MTEREEDTLSEEEYQNLSEGTLVRFNQDAPWTFPIIREGDILEFIHRNPFTDLMRFKIIKTLIQTPSETVAIGITWECWNVLEYV